MLKSAAMIFPLNELLKSTIAKFFPPEIVTSFEEVKALLADCSLLAYQEAEATLTVSTGAPQIVVGAVLEQMRGPVVQPLAFFSAKLIPTQTRYSTFGRELLVV